MALITVVGALGCASTGGAKATEGEAERAGAEKETASAENAAVWEAAASRGVTFRAVGQEPGWVLELFDGSSPRLEATLEYGDRSVVLDSVQQSGDAYTGTTADGTLVRLRIQEEPCVDTMSGERFPNHATLEVGTDVFRGCGRTLSR